MNNFNKINELEEQMVLDSISLPICCTNFDGELFFCNDEFLRTFYKDGANSISELFSKEHLELELFYNNQIKEFQNQKPTFDVTIELKSQKRTFRVKKSAYYNKSGQVYGVVSVYVDVEDYVEEGRLLKCINIEMEALFKNEVVERLKTQTIFEQIIENSQDAIVMLNEKGHVIVSNNAVETLLGYSRDDLKDNDFHKLILNSHDYEKFKRGFSEFQKSGKGVVVGKILEYVVQTKSGKRIPIEISVSALKVGDVYYSIGIIRDLRERKAQEVKRLKEERIIEQKHKAIIQGEMIGAIAHQWRQPINIISSEMMRLKMNLDNNAISKNDLIKTIDMINKQLNFMNKTIDDFRYFFGAISDDEWFDILEAIMECVEFLSYRLNANSIEITIKDKESYPIFGSKSSFRHIILILLNNSIDAILEKRKVKDNLNYGHIEIYVRRADTFAEIFIKDDGIGIKDEVKQFLFTPNFTTKGKSGSGIGLYLAREITKERFHGTIYLTDDKAHDGAIFVIKLSLLQRERERETKMAPRGHRGIF